MKGITGTLGISYGSVYDIVHDSLGCCKVSCQWVPKLNDVHKGKPTVMSLNHLEHYVQDGDSFLELIVTGDETWVLHYTPETK